jgi:hypothetical protein
MNRSRNLSDAIEKLWEILDSNPELFVVFIKKQDSDKKIFMAENEDDVKIVRVFISRDDADAYCLSKKNTTQYIYVVRMTYEKIYTSIVLIHASGNKIECRLTALDTDGNLYDIEKLWTANVN